MCGWGSLKLALNDLMTMRSKVNDHEWIHDENDKMNKQTMNVEQKVNLGMDRTLRN